MLASNLGLITRNETAKRWLAAISTAFHLDKFRVHINVRDMQRMYCRAK